MRKQSVNCVSISEAAAENCWHIFYQEISFALQAMPHSCDKSFYTAARASQSGKANGFTDCTCDLSMLILLLLPLLPDRRNQGLCNNNILRKSCPTASTSGRVDPLSL